MENDDRYVWIDVYAWTLWAKQTYSWPASLNRSEILIFSATMRRFRYKFIIKHKCFDDFESQNERWKHDWFAAMSSLFEQCNRRFGAALVPEDYISLDKTRYSTRNQVDFKQYNPDKPAKVVEQCSLPLYIYIYQTHVYCGNPTEAVNEYYIKRISNYKKYLVQKLS